MQKKNSSRVFIILLVFVLWQCASQGYPEGGPKDETPPQMVSSEPPMDAMNFDGDEIVIEFNELVVLEKAIQKIVVSPPLNEQPSFTGRGNEVTVKFNEELQPATTYTIDFADAIRDNNEGNPIEGFTFSFSTGETKDSLRISGHLLEAETHKPVEGALVMAHSNHADSAFTNMVPPRVAKTNENGRFSIKNLAEGDYRIFALEDANRNYRFDLWNERIAFHPELVEPHYEWRERTDSLFKDSVTLDTVMVYDELVYLPDSLQLFLFQEEDDRQFLEDDNRAERHRMDFIFNRPLRQKLGVELVEPEPENDDWFIYERSAKHDSVMIWLNDSSLISRDSLRVEATYQVRDSLNELVMQRDTLMMVSRSTDRDKSDEAEEKIPSVTPLPVRMKSGTQDIRGSTRLNFPVPVDRINREGMEVAQLVDTVYQPVKFELEQDTVRIRQYEILHEREPGKEYRVTIDSAAIRDVYGRPNNEVSSKFSIKEEDNYGTLYINLETFKDNALLQVLDTKDKVIRKGKVPDGGKLAFRYVNPGSYFLRLLYDKNDNGEWDTGDFSEDLQPEKVHYYPDTIDVRANWDQVVPWDMEEHSLFEFVEKNRIKKEENAGSRGRNQRR